jgi:hypothetical protein
MELNWYCTGVLGMKQQSCWGVLWFFKRPWILPLEKQRNRQYDIWCLITNAWANRVAIFSFVITKIFNPYKHWMVTIQPSVLYVQGISVYLFLLPVFCRCSSVVPFSFASVLFLFNLLCSIQCLLILFIKCIFWPITGIVFQEFWVLILLASTELRLYWTSLPRLIISRTIWSEWTLSRLFPLACRRMSLERIVDCFHDTLFVILEFAGTALCGW